MSSIIIPMLPAPYRVIRALGKGGFGSIWLVFNEETGTQAIAKIALDPNGSLRDEAEKLRIAQHPNVPRMLEIVTLPTGDDAIIMAFISGDSLAYLVEQHGPRPAHLVRRWTLQLCDVLLTLHTCHPPLIHRDIKPANIIVQPSGQVALVDFGIARSMKAGQAYDTVPLGSIGWAAPEQYGKAPRTSERSDLYSLAATMAYCVTGFDFEAAPLTIPPLDNIGDDALGSLLTDALQHAVGARPQSAEVWIQRLGGIVSSSLHVQMHSPMSTPDGSRCVSIPGGAFLSGPALQRHAIPAYSLACEPVTVGQWRHYLGIGGNGPAVDATLDASLPITAISWIDADAYCRFFGLRLPTALEWEKAARGTDGRIYPWGSTWLPGEVIAKPVYSGAQPVAHRGISPYGVGDLLGNVWEWSSAREGLSAVACGGCWRNHADTLACWTQQRFAIDVRQSTVGFRVAC